MCYYQLKHEARRFVSAGLMFMDAIKEVSREQESKVKQENIANQYYVNQYLSWKATYAPRASINYRIWLERFFKIVTKEIEKISIDDVIRYHRWVENHFSPYSVQFAMIIIKNFFKFLKYQNLPVTSPELIKIPKIRAKSHIAITHEEYQKLLSFRSTEKFYDLRDHLIIRLLWETGVRVSELCGLNLSDIETKYPSTVISTKKSYKVRRIFWSEETHRLLLNYIGVRICLNQTEPLFVGRPASTRLARRSVERLIRNLCQEAGIIKKITPHSFRHGWAHYRRDKGAQLSFIQAGLGHLDPASTFVYEQYVGKDLEQEARKFLI